MNQGRFGEKQAVFLSFPCGNLSFHLRITAGERLIPAKVLRLARMPVAYVALSRKQS